MRRSYRCSHWRMQQTTGAQLQCLHKSFSGTLPCTWIDIPQAAHAPKKSDVQTAFGFLWAQRKRRVLKLKRLSRDVLWLLWTSVTMAPFGKTLPMNQWTMNQNIQLYYYYTQTHDHTHNEARTLDHLVRHCMCVSSPFLINAHALMCLQPQNSSSQIKHTQTHTDTQLLSIHCYCVCVSPW